MWRLDFVLDGKDTWDSVLPAMESRSVVEGVALHMWLDDIEMAHVRVVDDSKYALNAPYEKGSEGEQYLVSKFHQPPGLFDPIEQSA